MSDKPLKLYLIHSDHQDYDYFEGHVVSAYDEADALELIKDQPYEPPFDPTITLLAERSLHAHGIVLGSFHAG